MGAEGGKAGVFEVGLGKLAGADPEVRTLEHWPSGCLPDRECLEGQTMSHSSAALGWPLVGLRTDWTLPLWDLGQVLPLSGP